MNTATHTEERNARTACCENSARFEYTMLGLGTVLFLTVTSAASILITLPEALESVASPAFGAPWITAAPNPGARSDVHAARHACAQ